MAAVTLKTIFYYYYQPYYNSQPGSCTNHFSSVNDVYEYIDQQISDFYNQREDFEGSHTGNQGQILETVNMNIINVSNEEICIKIYDWNLSEVEVRLESRDQLELITELFD